MMKMYLLAGLLLITTSVFAESPTDKGVYSLGGSISYSDIDSDDSDARFFEFSPSGRYFIYDNIAIGGSLTYSKTSGSGSFDSKSYGIGPNIRYYLPYEKVNPFIEAGYSYLRNKYKNSLFTSKRTSDEYTIGFGLDLFISRNVSIEPTVSYSWMDYKSDIRDIDMDEKTLYFGIGVNLFIF